VHGRALLFLDSRRKSRVRLARRRGRPIYYNAILKYISVARLGGLGGWDPPPNVTRITLLSRMLISRIEIDFM
jgi:hypothetical protein